MKTTPLTVRQFPPKLRRALKKSAKSHGRDLSQETMVWLEKQAQEKAVTGKEAAAILRKFQKLLTDDDRRRIADGIEEARRRIYIGADAFVRWEKG